MSILDFKAKPIDTGIEITLTGTGCHPFPFLVQSKIGRTLICEGITIEQIKHGSREYSKGKTIQEAFNFMTPNQREFIQSGLHEKEFEKLAEEYAN